MYHITWFKVYELTQHIIYWPLQEKASSCYPTPQLSSAHEHFPAYPPVQYSQYNCKLKCNNPCSLAVLMKIKNIFVEYNIRIYGKNVRFGCTFWSLQILSHFNAMWQFLNYKHKIQYNILCMNISLACQKQLKQMALWKSFNSFYVASIKYLHCECFTAVLWKFPACHIIYIRMYMQQYLTQLGCTNNLLQHPVVGPESFPVHHLVHDTSSWPHYK